MALYFKMLRKPALAVTTALIVGMAMPVHAAPNQEGGQMCQGMHGKGQMSSITVNGQGEVRIAPDQAGISLGVTTQAASAAEAMSQNGTQQTSVINALKEVGIEGSDIQTSGLTLSPMVDYGENGQNPKVTGYQASNMVTIRVKEVDRLGEILDKIVAAGANEINSINFTREDSAAAEDDARRAAVQDARHRAEILAEAAGLTLGPLLVMRDQPQPGGRPEPMMMKAAMADQATPVEAGELSLTSSVEIVYALVGEGACETGGAASAAEAVEPEAESN